MTVADIFTWQFFVGGLFGILSSAGVIILLDWISERKRVK